MVNYMAIWLAAIKDIACPYVLFEGVQGVRLLRVSTLGEKN